MTNAERKLLGSKVEFRIRRSRLSLALFCPALSKFVRLSLSARVYREKFASVDAGYHSNEYFRVRNNFGRTASRKEAIWKT